jgi:hypothetical protein
MTTTENLTTTQPLPEVFEVYFMDSPVRGSLVELLFNRANADYHKVFGYSGSIVHCAVRFGQFVYEVTSEGTEKYPWTPSLLQNIRIVGFYTLDLKPYNRDKILAALFTLENQLGRKLDIRGCLRYMWQCLGFGKTENELARIGAAAKENGVGLLPGSFVKEGRKVEFHLPYTCATLVNIVLKRLLNYDPCFTGHLAQSAAMSLSIFAEFGTGSVYDLDAEEFIIDNR